MKGLVILVAVAGLALVACKKKEDAASAQTNQPLSNPVATEQPLPPPPAYVAGAAENAPQQSAVGQVNPFLTEQLRIFAQQQRRLPKSFAELASSRLDSVPGPPPGTKWAIDASSMTVKAVKAQ